MQTQLQTGSKSNNAYEQIYKNNGFTRLSFTSSGVNSSNQSTQAGLLAIYGSNDESTWTTLLSAAASGTVSIAGYKYIKLATGITSNTYGMKFTFNLDIS